MAVLGGAVVLIIWNRRTIDAHFPAVFVKGTDGPLGEVGSAVLAARHLTSMRFHRHRASRKT